MITRICILSACFLVGLCPQGRADGDLPSQGGEFGVNRRVITNPDKLHDVTGLSGKWSEPARGIEGKQQIFVPFHLEDIGEKTNTRPTFYVGSASSGIEVDAGFQLEPYSSFGGSLKEGWIAFISRNGVMTQYSRTTDLDNRVVYRWPRGQIGLSAVMSYNILKNGQVELDVSGMTSAEQPSVKFKWVGDGITDSINAKGRRIGKDNAGNDKFAPVSMTSPVYTVTNGVINSTIVKNMAIKRVVGMTQPGAINIDGSWMKNLGFAEGQLYTATRNAGGNLTFTDQAINSSPVQGGWPVSVLGDKTGYNTPDWAYDSWIQEEDKRRWIVDFDFAGMQTPTLRGPGDTADPNGNYRKVAVPARYVAETVHFHLVDGPMRPKGRLLTIK